MLLTYTQDSRGDREKGKERGEIGRQAFEVLNESLKRERERSQANFEPHRSSLRRQMQSFLTSSNRQQQSFLLAQSHACLDNRRAPGS